MKASLRIKLKGKMDKRTERAAAEGCIAIATRGDTASLVELRAETDFTAKNERFSKAAQKIAELALDAPREGDLKPAAAITVIARDTALRGEVAGKASLRVEGRVAGSIAVDGTLEVAEGATVEAEVRAGVARIAGTVTGNVTATRLIELLATARVKGDLTAPALHVVEGASLEGRVVMASAEKPAGTPPTAR